MVGLAVLRVARRISISLDMRIKYWLEQLFYGLTWKRATVILLNESSLLGYRKVGWYK